MATLRIFTARVIGADVVDSLGDTMKHAATIVKMATFQVSSQLRCVVYFIIVKDVELLA